MHAVRIPEEQRAPRELGLPGYRGEQPSLGPKEAQSALLSSSTGRAEKKTLEDCAQRVFSRQVVLGYPPENRHPDTHLPTRTAGARAAGTSTLKPERNLRASSDPSTTRSDRVLTASQKTCDLIGLGDNYPRDNYLDNHRPHI